MDFSTARYLDWYLPRMRGGEGVINLHASGVPALDLGAALARGDAPLGDPWAWNRAFEAALSRWLDLPAEELVYTPGATGGNLLALLALGAPGKGFLVEQPVYEPMLRQAERLGPVRRLQRRPEAGWALDPGEAERAMGSDTGVVLVTEPHNPSGVFTPRERVAELSRVAESRGAILLVNEVYRGFSERPSLHGLAPNLLVVSSLSKLFGAYSARLGWISGPAALVDRCRRAHLTFGPQSGAGAAAGLSILERAEELRAEARRRSSAVSLVDDWVASTPGVSWVRPQGPGYGCLALPPGTEDIPFAERLHERHGVLTVPGSLWEQPGSLRISWLQSSEEDLGTGLGRLAAALGEPA
ncbi:MAG: pyridoxal phosphate-dependent aminotransferase [Polyangia bacterium]|jgi:aspartate/methionine/tyrosine aminotransferase|nr:pyridoxal phosphate-dependent aminotransferase [Polyangia bacterium]